MDSLLSWLPLLACPVGMGLMMWLMMRGNNSQTMGSGQRPAQHGPTGRSTVDPSPDERLGQLRAQLAEIQAQQAAIAEQIARLSAEARPVEPGHAARTDRVEPAPSPTGRPGAAGLEST